MSRAEITVLEELQLLCYWQQLGNKWVEIAKLMGRAENWVKNNWKKVIKREGITPESALSEKVIPLIEKLKLAVEAEKKQGELMSSPDPQDEFSDSEFSKSKLEDVGMEYMLSEFAIEEVKETPLSYHEDVYVGEGFESKTINNAGGILNTESEEYDFAASTYERQIASDIMELDIPDIHKYIIPNHEKSPFSDKRTII